jgi:predicted CoA-binding protein
MLVTTDLHLRRVLQQNRSLAVVGAKSDTWEAAYYVPAYLAGVGWRPVGVNPKLAGQTWLGSPAVGALRDLPAPVDLIEVFRRAEFLPALAEELLALPWRPRAVWFQLGIRHGDAARRLSEAGIDVVQDRCMMPEHRRLCG